MVDNLDLAISRGIKAFKFIKQRFDSVNNALQVTTEFYADKQDKANGRALLGELITRKAYLEKLSSVTSPNEIVGTFNASIATYSKVIALYKSIGVFSTYDDKLRSDLSSSLVAVQAFLNTEKTNTRPPLPSNPNSSDVATPLKIDNKQKNALLAKAPTGGELAQELKAILDPLTSVKSESVSKAVKAKPTLPPCVPKLPSQQSKWGVRFSHSNCDSFFFSLLPAYSSSLKTQGGLDVPNAQPGLSFSIKPNIAKMRIPGSSPVFQHLGIDTVMVTLVGRFSGQDGTVDSIDENLKPAPKDKNSIYKDDELKVDTLLDLDRFYKFSFLQGKELEVEINLSKYFKNSDSRKKIGLDKDFAGIRDYDTGNIKFKGHLRQIESYYAKASSTYYTIQLEISDFGLVGKNAVAYDFLLQNAKTLPDSSTSSGGNEALGGKEALVKFVEDNRSKEVHPSGEAKEDPGSVRNKIQKGEQIFVAVEYCPSGWLNDPASLFGLGCRTIFGVQDNPKSAYRVITEKEYRNGSKGGTPIANITTGDFIQLAVDTLACAGASGGAAVSAGALITGAIATATGVGAPLGVPTAAAGTAGFAVSSAAATLICRNTFNNFIELSISKDNSTKDGIIYAVIDTVFNLATLGMARFVAPALAKNFAAFLNTNRAKFKGNWVDKWIEVLEAKAPIPDITPPAKPGSGPTTTTPPAAENNLLKLPYSGQADLVNNVLPDLKGTKISVTKEDGTIVEGILEGIEDVASGDKSVKIRTDSGSEITVSASDIYKGTLSKVNVVADSYLNSLVSSKKAVTIIDDTGETYEGVITRANFGDQLVITDSAGNPTFLKKSSIRNVKESRAAPASIPTKTTSTGSIDQDYLDYLDNSLMNKQVRVTNSSSSIDGELISRTNTTYTIKTAKAGNKTFDIENSTIGELEAAPPPTTPVTSTPLVTAPELKVNAFLFDNQNKLATINISGKTYTGTIRINNGLPQLETNTGEILDLNLTSFKQKDIKLINDSQYLSSIKKSVESNLNTKLKITYKDGSSVEAYNIADPFSPKKVELKKSTGESVKYEPNQILYVKPVISP